MIKILFKAKTLPELSENYLGAEWKSGFYARIQIDDSTYLHVIKEDTTTHISNVTKTTFKINPETLCQYVRDDINGKPIFEHQKFTFTFRRNYPFESMEGIGSFIYVPEELKFMVNIFNGNSFYRTNFDRIYMSNFQLIEDNPSI